jgi:Co/Zn/Cd efflux system component
MTTTSYIIARMDCSSEEQMVRMKLSLIQGIHFLEFDIPNRKLTVYHDTAPETILQKLEELDLGASLLETEETVKEVSAVGTDRKLLVQVLVINFVFFVLELVFGVFSGSMGLIADSLDMLADSLVYGMALLVAGSSVVMQKRTARVAGVVQLVLAVAGIAEVFRRFFGTASGPDFQTMIIVSFSALIANAVTLLLLQKSNNKEVHMQASMIFTSNDVIANLGVVVAGVLVYLTGSGYPDLIVGILVFLLVGRGAFRIYRLST